MQFTSPIDREICQAAFGKVQRGIAYFRQQVQAAIESRLHDAVVHEVLALADAMEQEVIAAVTGAGIQADGVSYNRAYCSQVMPAAALCGGESPERGSYESMRQALQDTQRRCANLLANIYKESEVNRALSKAKAKAEACSKKLTEQVSQQTEEINRLAQTISAQEQLEEAHKKTRIEVNLREKDFQRKLAAARKDADDRCNALQESLVNKLHSTRRAAEKVKKDFDRLREDYEDSRKAVHILNEADLQPRPVKDEKVMSQLIGQTEMTISHRMEALVKSSIEQRVSSTDAARALEETEQLRADQAQSGSFCARLAEARTDAASQLAQPLTFWQAHEKSIHDLGFAPSESRMLMSCGAEGSVAVWDADSGNLDCRLMGHIGVVTTVAVCPTNSELLATGGEDHTVRLWDLRDIEPSSQLARMSREKVMGVNLAHFTLKGHESGVSRVRFTGDGQLLASVSKDCSARIWIPSLFNPLLVAKFVAHEAWIRDVAWASDQKSLFTAAADGMVFAWEVPSKYHAQAQRGGLRGPRKYKAV